MTLAQLIDKLDQIKHMAIERNLDIEECEVRVFVTDGTPQSVRVTHRNDAGLTQLMISVG